MSYVTVGGKEVTDPVVTTSTTKAPPSSPTIGRRITGSGGRASGSGTGLSFDNRFTGRKKKGGEEEEPTEGSIVPWVVGGLALLGIGVAVARSR